MNSYNAVTDTLDEVDYFSYRAITAPKTKEKKGFDPDLPTYAQAMSSPEAHEWQAAMDEEVKVHGLETRQVDYVNAFAQADLEKDVFIEITQGFEHSNEVDCVLKLNKSLCGMSDAPLTSSFSACASLLV